VITLANWFWQGCALALAAHLMLRAAGRASASTRHGLWWVALFLVLLLPALHVPAEFAPAQAVVNRIPAYSLLPTVSLPNAATLTAVAAWAWTAWAVLSLLRLALALRGLSAARRACVPFPARRERRLCQWNLLRTRGRGARLLVCARVRRAGVLGGGRPAIVVSPDLLEALDDREVDQVIAHEWVHVQRRDDVTVVVQALVRAFAGLHPAVWWINRQIDFERELACDELAVRVTGSVREYAQCLTKLASLPSRTDALRLAPAASSSRLSARIVRLLAHRDYPPRSHSALAFTLVGAVLLWLAPVTASVQLVEAETAAPASNGSGESPVAALAQAALSATSPTSLIASSLPAPAADPGQAVGDEPTEGAAVPVPAPDRGTPRADQAPAPGRPDAGTGRAERFHGPEAPAVAPLTTLPGHLTAPEWPSFGGAGTERTETPWGAAANSGVAIGKGSQKAAVATARFFNNLGRKIGGSF
jgi:beta-lactamase regulating signal transducer with metallopeptidase domain